MPRKRQASTLGRSLRCPRCKAQNLEGVRGRGGARYVVQTPTGGELVLFRLRCPGCGNERVVGFVGVVDTNRGRTIADLAAKLDESGASYALKAAL